MRHANLSLWWLAFWSRSIISKPPPSRAPPYSCGSCTVYTLNWRWCVIFRSLQLPHYWARWAGTKHVSLRPILGRACGGTWKLLEHRRQEKADPTCYSCGARVEESPLPVRVFLCGLCGLTCRLPLSLSDSSVPSHANATLLFARLYYTARLEYCSYTGICVHTTTLYI